NLVLAAGTFAETTGTFVNYEGRAQHFYATFKPKQEIQSSAKWLCDSEFGKEPRIHVLTGGAAAILPNGYKLQKLTPGADWSFAGQRAPRQHHRYSGRTAMRAHLNVHEPKQEQDEDGIMNYSMEGVPPTKDATIFSSPWAPGWNSNQSVFKFQKTAGGELTQGGNGELLLDAFTGTKTFYPATTAKAAINGFAMFPIYHLFGSEELTARSEAIQAKATAAYVALNPVDIAKLGLGASDGVQVQHNGSVPYLARASVAPGTVGITVGLSGLNFQNMTTAGVALNKATNWQNPKDWRASNIIVSDAGSSSAYGRGIQGK
ncbi:MAG: hypothetical protein V4603_11385, partial [Pseudomonadota bacterium]